MNLSPGTRLGSYEIVAVLGSGGMGEVYRARDTRLGRDVAVKILASRLAGNPEAQARFEREARAVAALSHPNILALFDYGESSGILFTVSELLQGETLRDRLAVRPLPLRKAVEYAVQMARGLAAAHDRGIVHRDLKPENVFLTRDGQVKILDFGLVRVTGAGPDRTVAASPALSRSGMVVGTAGYMSPEQIRGHSADERSDLFAFGAILYEMLAGRRAFPGETAAEIMTATLREEPPELPASVPAALSRLVRRCLEKRPEERFRSAHDLAFGLEALVEPASGGLQGAAPPPPAKRGRRIAPLLLASLLAATVAAGAGLARWLWRTPPPSPPAFHQLTFGRGPIFAARFAPGGDTIVYGAAWDGNPLQVYTMRTERPEASQLAFPSGADILAVSRSGEIALTLGKLLRGGGIQSIGTLAVAPLAGGSPRKILEDVYQADWAPDGSSLAVVRLSPGSGENWLEYPIGRVILKSSSIIQEPRVSPVDGRLAAAEQMTGGYRLLVFDRAGRRERAFPLKPGFLLGIAWHPSGKEVWYSLREDNGSSLYAVRLNGEQRLVYRSVGWTSLNDISEDGKVLLGVNLLRFGMGALPPGEAAERNLSWFEMSVARDLSDDGRIVLFDEQGHSGKGRGVYLRATDGSPPVHLGQGRARALSPEGKWVLATDGGTMILLPTGAGESKRILRGISDTAAACSWFPDGRRILCAERGSKNRPGRLYMQNLAGGEPRAVTPAGFGLSGPYAAHPLSPDGRQTVATDPEGRLWVYPLAGGVPRIAAGFKLGDDFLRWSGDGRSLFVWRRDSLSAARVLRLDLATGQREPWLEVRPPDPAGVCVFVSLVLTPDGKSYAYTYGRLLTDLYLAEGLR